MPSPQLEEVACGVVAPPGGYLTDATVPMQALAPDSESRVPVEENFIPRRAQPQEEVEVLVSEEPGGIRQDPPAQRVNGNQSAPPSSDIGRLEPGPMRVRVVRNGETRAAIKPATVCDDGSRTMPALDPLVGKLTQRCDAWRRQAELASIVLTDVNPSHAVKSAQVLESCTEATRRATVFLQDE